MHSSELDPNRLRVPLSDEELDELDEFLLSGAVSDKTMTLDMLDGYLTAIVVGPKNILPSRWLLGIWGDSEADAPDYASKEQAQRILELLMRHMNGIIWALQDDPESFEPILSMVKAGEDSREYLDAETWAYGFLTGIDLAREDWQPLYDDAHAAAALHPIELLVAEEEGGEEESSAQRLKQREALALQLAASVAAIYRFWLPRRKEAHERLIAETVRRAEPKVGRNDLCPCGSGKKYKKCCGAAPTLH